MPLLGGLVIGCQSGPRSDWEYGDAPISRSRRRSAPPRTKIPLTRPPPEGDDISPEQLAHELELALLRFTARRRALAREFPPTQGLWPIPMTRAWEDILQQLESGLRRSEIALPRRLLVQARVSLEAELELTGRRFGNAEAGLQARIQAVFVQVALRMRRPRPRPEGDSRMASARFGWPVSPLIVTSPFGYRRDPILGPGQVRFHAGLDLGGRRGDVVVAAGPGRVVGAGWQGGHGRTVTLQHASGFVTLYAHLARVMVRVGDEIDAGSPVGLMGSSGRSTGPHLHFEVRRNNVPVDPLEVLKSQTESFARR